MICLLETRQAALLPAKTQGETRLALPQRARLKQRGSSRADSLLFFYFSSSSLLTSSSPLREDSYRASLVLRSLLGGFLLHRDALQRILSTG